MPFGYTGQNLPNQTKANSGVFSISDVADLEKQGKFGGSLELIAESNPSGVNVVDITDIQESKYNVHFLQVEVTMSGAGSLHLQFFESGVLESGAVYQYSYQNASSAGNFSTSKGTGGNRMFVTRPGDTNKLRTAYNYLYNLGDANKYSYQTVFGGSDDGSTATLDIRFGGGALPQTSVVDGIRLTETSGIQTITGNIKLYGVKQI